MASVSSSGRALAGSGDLRTPVSDENATDAFLRPIMAGAFARGVADTFELLGVAAFFLDRDGHVLFATDAAKARAKGSLTVQSGHLLARTQPDNHMLATFVEHALRDAASRPVVTLVAAGVALQALPVPGREPMADQLLHAIVVVTASPASLGTNSDLDPR